MNENTIKILTEVYEKVSNGTDIIIAELTRYYVVTGMMKIAAIAAVTAMAHRLLTAGIRAINLVDQDKQTPTDTFYKGLIRFLQVGVIVVGLVLSYQDMLHVVKAGLAPHLFFLEVIKPLIMK